MRKLLAQFPKTYFYKFRLGYGIKKKAWELCLLPVPRVEAFALPGIVERATPIAHADMLYSLPSIKYSNTLFIK